MRRRPPSTTQLHQDWLAQVETDGPFLSLPVLKDMWPNGMEPLSDVDDRLVTFKENHAVWEQAFDRSRNESAGQYADVARSWVDVVLDVLAGWEGHRVAPGELPGDLVVRSPGETIAVNPDGALRGRDGELACLLQVVPPTDSLHAAGLDGWSASEVDRMAALLRKADVAVGVVTDGRWWALVWAGEGTTTGSGVVDALSWREEARLRDAFLTLVSASTLRHANSERRLPQLFARSVLEAEEITEALGVQVRKSVELLVQAFSEARLSARGKGLDDPLCEDPDEIYQAAVTAMMRVVFLLFAEERGMLPTPELYRAAYGISDLLDDLQGRAQREGEENLDHSTDVWHRLLAVSTALYGGANFDEVRMPAYGGSLFDSQRFPWLAAERPDGGLHLRVSDRVMLHVLESVQVAKVGGQARRISFRDVDVEQIGYIYEGLLGYTCREVDAEVVLGLVGKDGEEPEIDLDTLDEIYEESRGAKDFATKLTDWVKQTQPAAKLVSATKLAKLHDADVDEAEMNRLLKPIAGDDPDLLPALVSWGNLIRRDLRDLPYVVPRGGLVVSETPSRKNAGAHYTPRSLAEEVVLHALQPLVYEPGPLQTNDEDAWRRKSSSAILDLKVADIAAGSGAFLVAAARYLADRLVEAWTAEGIVDGDHVDPGLRNRAIREVIAHCLYGADINGMAVEMCKLSLWLVSLDPSKPFSFVDDKVFHGNSLLGLATLDQLRYLHIAPETKKSKGQLNAYVDAEAVLAEVIRIRHQLATTVDEDDPQRTRNGKRRLLKQSAQVTEKLRLIADGIVATALRLGGKPGTALDDAYTALEGALIKAFPADGALGDTSGLDRIAEQGLTPTVATDYSLWRPLHWIIEAPDVLIEHGGFDAIIGNPPFLVGKKITAAVGVNFREFMVRHVASGKSGNADLVAYFVVRAASLLAKDRGQCGLITAKVIAEGDTREVGLDQLQASGHAIRRAIRSESWPSSLVATRYAVVWLTRKAPAGMPRPTLDGVPVEWISSSLEEATKGGGTTPSVLLENRGRAFKGYEFAGGDAFLIDTAAAASLIATDPRNREVVLPFLNGRDLNSSPSQTGERSAIFFRNFSKATASTYSAPFALVARAFGVDGQEPEPTSKWWLFRRNVQALTEAMDTVSSVLGIAAVSSHALPIRVPTGRVVSSAIIVVPTEDRSMDAILSSAAHSAWSIRWGSTLGVSLRYTVTDVFDTFPRSAPTDRLVEIGEALEVERRGIMIRRGLGLTALYNLVNDSSLTRDVDIAQLREIHIEIDEATMESYGWTDLKLQTGFHTYRGVERFGISGAARTELLDRLLAENHRRAALEGKNVPSQGVRS